jgi:asparagine synthase (glutamine-hydrolysing)
MEAIDRVVDLVGPRTSALSGATADQIVSAVAGCDLSALAATDGHFAVMARDGRTVRLARTIGIPLRYFVAKMYHGPYLVVSDRIDRIFEWCTAQRIGWQFDPAYTRMVPAHHVVELDQVGCPDPVPRYHRFFEPIVGQGPEDLDAAGESYISSAFGAVKRWAAAVPDDATIGVAFSGGVDSLSVLLIARYAFEELGRSPDQVRAFTLDLGGGTDAAQAADAVRALGLEHSWERIVALPFEYDLEAAIRTIEDYHPLDVECAAAGLCLLNGIRRNHPALTYLLDGDGGDENLKSYPLEDSDLTLSSVLRNPLLYQEGWGVDAIKHSAVYSGGLSRGYVRSYAPAAAHGFHAYSPYTVRSVIAASAAIPFERLLDGNPDRLATLKQDVVRRGIRRVLGIDMPVYPKRRFQDGILRPDASAGRGGRQTPSGLPIVPLRPSKTWCRNVFTRHWEERLRDTPDALGSGSGNEIDVPVTELSPFV